MGKKRPPDPNKVRLDKKMCGDLSQFLTSIGYSFLQQRNLDVAGESLKFAIEVDPTNHAAAYNLGIVFNVGGMPDQAHRVMTQAYKMAPDHLMTKISLCEVSRKLGRIEQAEQLIGELMETAPHEFMVLQAKAIIDYDLGRFESAMRYNDAALKLMQSDTHLLLNKALINMGFGRWSDWWWLYEHTLSYGKNNQMRGFKMQDAWPGDEREGQSLLIISDQGFGDALQFGRYIPEIKERGKFSKVIFAVQPDLVSLLKRSGVADEVVGFGMEEDIKFDNFSSLLGVMRILKIDPSNAFRQPHIFADKKLMKYWRARLGEESRDIRVGLVWAGDPKHGNDVNRSLKLTDLAPILDLKGVDFYSFQVGNEAKQLGNVPVTDLGSEFRDYEDTAAALALMDLIVTVDTSVAHLAGCMGVRTYALLPLNGEWRWLIGEPGGHAQTPWYGDNFEVWRQDKFRDWSNIVQRVAEDIKKEVGLNERAKQSGGAPQEGLAFHR